jgi:hypothetical protein
MRHFDSGRSEECEKFSIGTAKSKVPYPFQPIATSHRFFYKNKNTSQSLGRLNHRTEDNRSFRHSNALIVGFFRQTKRKRA